MKIKLFGNCSILITTKEGQVLIDPYFSNKGNIMFRRGQAVCQDFNKIKNLDAILLSHDHFDHMDFTFLSNYKNKYPLYAPKMSIKSLFFNRKPVKKGMSFKIKDMYIDVVQANHTCPSVGYVIKTEGKTIYFSGDTYYGDFMKDIESNFKIDAAILPVTNYFPPMTMGKLQAVKAIELLKSEYFIPVHKDLVKRTNSNNSTITKEELTLLLKDKNINSQLVYLENGEEFTLEELGC